MMFVCQQRGAFIIFPDNVNVLLFERG